MPKKNGAFGRSAANSTSITVPSNDSPADPAVTPVTSRSATNVTMAAGTTTTRATRPAKRCLPIVSSA